METVYEVSYYEGGVRKSDTEKNYEKAILIALNKDREGSIIQSIHKVSIPAQKKKSVWDSNDFPTIGEAMENLQQLSEKLGEKAHG